VVVEVVEVMAMGRFGSDGQPSVPTAWVKFVALVAAVMVVVLGNVCHAAIAPQSMAAIDGDQYRFHHDHLHDDEFREMLSHYQQQQWQSVSEVEGEFVDERVGETRSSGSSATAADEVRKFDARKPINIFVVVRCASMPEYYCECYDYVAVSWFVCCGHCWSIEVEQSRQEQRVGCSIDHRCHTLVSTWLLRTRPQLILYCFILFYHCRLEAQYHDIFLFSQFSQHSIEHL
jgi:hypothetical protein